MTRYQPIKTIAFNEVGEARWDNHVIRLTVAGLQIDQKSPGRDLHTTYRHSKIFVGDLFHLVVYGGQLLIFVGSDMSSGMIDEAELLRQYPPDNLPLATQVA